MKLITWINDNEWIGGTCLRNSQWKEHGNLALHVGGDIDAIINNRKKCSEALNIPLQNWVFPQQTHSDHLKKVTAEDRGKGVYTYESGIPDCDALYTKERQVALGVFHADCVPILLYDPIEGIVCAVHSGWQGTVKEITRKVLGQLIRDENVQPENIRAFIGPAIGYSSFEVGRDVIDKVHAMSFDTSPFIMMKANGKAYVDGKGLNKKMLLDAGVCNENITVDKNDTFTNNDTLFSFRRDAKCGRHISFIMKK